MLYAISQSELDGTGLAAMPVPSPEHGNDASSVSVCRSGENTLRPHARPLTLVATRPSAVTVNCTSFGQPTACGRLCCSTSPAVETRARWSVSDSPAADPKVTHDTTQ
jgi:hypothetical protein